MRILNGLAGATLLIPAMLIASSRAEAGPIGDCVGGPIPVGYAYTGATTNCTVPFTGTYLLKAYGADGGDHPESTYNQRTVGGKGAFVSANFSLLAGDTLLVLVGGRGETKPGDPDYTSDFGGGGGGGTFVLIQRGGGQWQPLIVAGGGGGAGTLSNGQDGRGLDDDPNLPSGAGGEDEGGRGGYTGSGGGAGPQYPGGSGGAGWLSDGDSSLSAAGGRSVENGGNGGRPTGSCQGALGGFGGGGASGWTPCGDPNDAQADGAGGGGGYSGGGGGGFDNTDVTAGGAGGGGSSFISSLFAMTSPVVAPGGNIFGDGQVQIQWLTDADGNSVNVPEPGSLALLATGIFLLAQGGARRRKPG